jgi:DNA excision repair protein ERCC-3
MTEHDWGLIIYDEVHLLPAPIFRITAEIQARRRLGLTATLVREDEREADVFGLIGPKRFDVPWRELERQGWIATAECYEIRVALEPEERMIYAVSEEREKYRMAAENPVKMRVVDELIRRHAEDQVLVIGQYLDQLKYLAEMLDAPLLTGRTTNIQREKLYDQFRQGALKRLVVSKVANFAIDLPDANVAIQVSGTFGSRQEEAQRLGRLLRPKSDGRPAHFYTIVTRDTRDQEFSANRQLFLTEQGYRYIIEDAETAGLLVERPHPRRTNGHSAGNTQNNHTTKRGRQASDKTNGSARAGSRSSRANGTSNGHFNGKQNGNSASVSYQRAKTGTTPRKPRE